VGEQSLVFPLRRELSVLKLKQLFFEKRAVIKCFNKPASLTTRLSRKDEEIAKRAFPEKQQDTCQIFPHAFHFVLYTKQEICEYPFVTYR